MRLRGTVCPSGHVGEVFLASDELPQASADGVPCPHEGCIANARLASSYEAAGGVRCNPWRGVPKSARMTREVGQ